MSNYLIENRNVLISNIIFSIRSKTLDIKEYQPWKYENDLSVMCCLFIETMDHFMTCVTYKNKPCKDWWKIFENDTQVQFEVGCLVKKRFLERETELDKIGVGWALNSNSIAPGDC